MSPDAFDYSWARPSPPDMAAAGVKVAMRYLYSAGKGVDAAEVRALHAAGIGVGLNYEAQSGNHLLGARQGAVDSDAARAYAGRLGAPAGVPIYYSCDAEVTPATMPRVLDYLRAADHRDHPARCYAQASVCTAFGRPAWQTIAWSYGDMSPRAVLYQYAINQDFRGSAVDYNRIIDIDRLEPWWPAGSEHDMPTVKEIAAAVWAEHLTDGATDQAAGAWLKQARNRAVTAAAVADAVLAKLPPASGGAAITRADVRTATEAAVRAVLGGLDATP